MLKAVLKARDLVGTFDKPRYITFTDRSLRAFALAHRRLHSLPRPVPDRRDHAGRQSCRDRSHICAGCGQCAAVCPTGAASYALPPADALMRKLRALLTAYRDAGGERARRAAAR